MKKLKYNFDAIYLSLYSKIFFWDLIRNRKNTGISYIALLSLILSVIYCFVYSQYIGVARELIAQNAISITNDNTSSLKPALQDIVQQFPGVKVNGDKVEFNIDQPKIIESKNSIPSIVFDPTNKINALKFERAIIINNNNIIFKVLGQSQVFHFADINKTGFLSNYAAADGFLDNQKLVNDLVYGFYKLLPLIVPFVLIGGFLLNIFTFFVSQLFFAIMTLAVFNLMRIKNDDFKTALRISAYTQTPIFLLDALQLLTVQLFGMQLLVYFTLHILYIYFAIDNYRKIETLKSRIIL